MVLSLVVLASLGVARSVQDKSATEVDQQADCISTRPPPVSCQPTALAGAGGGGPVQGGPGGGGGTPSSVAADITLASGPTATNGAGGTYDVALGVTLKDAASNPLPDQVITAQVTISQSSVPSRVGQFFYVECTTNGAGLCNFGVNSRYPDVNELSIDVVSAGVDTNYDFGDLSPAVVGRPAP